MFGHLHRAITSGSHKPLSLNERLDSTRSVTGFAFAHFVPWRHHTRSKTDAANFGRTNVCTDGIFLKLGIQERQIIASKAEAPSLPL